MRSKAVIFGLELVSVNCSRLRTIRMWVIDFAASKVVDQSALQAIEDVARNIMKPENRQITASDKRLPSPAHGRAS